MRVRPWKKKKTNREELALYSEGVEFVGDWGTSSPVQVHHSTARHRCLFITARSLPPCCYHYNLHRYLHSHHKMHRPATCTITKTAITVFNHHNPLPSPLPLPYHQYPISKCTALHDIKLVYIPTSLFGGVSSPEIKNRKFLYTPLPGEVRSEVVLLLWRSINVLQCPTPPTGSSLLILTSNCD